ncbi:MAG: hypothetical protein IJG68_06000 [Bacilli bacterium]|nr:hypothetical protein [Bacilli bacterium]
MKKILLIIIPIVIILLGGVFFYLYEYTNVFHNKLIPTINSVAIEYAPGMNYSEAEEKNKNLETPMIEMQTISLKDKKFEKIKKELKRIKENTDSKKDNTYLAKLMINKNEVLYVGKKVGILQYKKKEKKVIITNSLLNDITTLIDKNNEKILETISFEKCVLKKDGASITLTNENNFKIIKNSLPHYKVSIADNFLTYENGIEGTVTLDDQTIIYLYNSNIGYIKTAEKEYYAIFPYELKNAVESIYKKSI